MTRPPVYLVACAKTKARTASAARALYRSPWFTKARAYVEATGSPWFILSAEHGLVHPDTVLGPYERTLVGMDRAARLAWAREVHGQLLVRRLLPPFVSRVVFLAGEAYCDPLADWISVRGRCPETVEVPMQGLGLGQQLAWLTAHAPPVLEAERDAGSWAALRAISARREARWHTMRYGRGRWCDALSAGQRQPLFRRG